MIARMRKITTMLLATTLLSSCSVGMAMSGSDNPDIGAVRVGATRGEVELQLGSPASLTDAGNGQRLAAYNYEIGNEPSAGRAAFHGVMDVLTLGGWEIIGTPVEGFQGTDHRVVVTYDDRDVVTAVRGN